eukprot:924486-Pyramimonas_sp.AAC.1
MQPTGSARCTRANRDNKSCPPHTDGPDQGHKTLAPTTSLSVCRVTVWTGLDTLPSLLSLPYWRPGSDHESQ